MNPWDFASLFPSIEKTKNSKSFKNSSRNPKYAQIRANPSLEKPEDEFEEKMVTFECEQLNFGPLRKSRADQNTLASQNQLMGMENQP